MMLYVLMISKFFPQEELSGEHNLRLYLRIQYPYHGHWNILGGIVDIKDGKTNIEIYSLMFILSIIINFLQSNCITKSLQPTPNIS